MQLTTNTAVYAAYAPINVLHHYYEYGQWWGIGGD